MESRTLLFSLIVFLLLACGNEDESVTPSSPSGTDAIAESQIAILALGDSRVEGARPFFESYRYELWKNLISANYDINFIGPFEDEASYPPFMGLDFDDEHAGIGGDTTEDVLSRLNQALNSSSRPPDVVILGIGGNDILNGASVEGTIDNINTIIDGIQAANGNVTIFLEQITGVRTDINGADALNALIPGMNESIAAVASAQTTSTSNVITVNMNTDFPDTLFIDDVHFNEAGAKEVADRYFAAFDLFFGSN